ncbi:MAG: FxsA family protein [Planctomycetaceae bacterium]
MLLRLLIIFLVIAMSELVLLHTLSSGSLFRFILMVVVVVGTGGLGVCIAHKQGLRTWQRIHERLSQGQSPSAELMDGVMILLGGVVLFTPGILTDIMGFVLLIPAARAPIGRWLVHWFRKQTTSRFEPGDPADNTTEPQVDDGIIDAEFTRRSSEDPAAGQHLERT